MYIIEKNTKRKNNFAEYIKYGDEKTLQKISVEEKKTVTLE